VLPAPAVSPARHRRVHLLDPQEIAFDFRRPMRFLDMEGGPSIFAEPSEIGRALSESNQRYLGGVLQVVRESAVDYHRVSIDENYEQLLIRFLVADQGTRPAMSFLQPFCWRPFPGGAADYHSPDQSAALSNGQVGRHDVFLLAANRMSRGYARLRQWLIMAMRMAAIAALVSR